MTTHESSSLAKAAEKFLVGKSRREVERLLARKAGPEVRKRRILSASNKWQEWELALLGRLPDREVVKRTGRSRGAVESKRRESGFLTRAAPDPPWTPDEIALLGKLPDKEIGRRLGRDKRSVHGKRNQFGIAKTAGLVRAWSKAEAKLLGTGADKEIARRLNLSL